MLALSLAIICLFKTKQQTQIQLHTAQTTSVITALQTERMSLSMRQKHNESEMSSVRRKNIGYVLHQQQ